MIWPPHLLPPDGREYLARRAWKYPMEQTDEKHLESVRRHLMSSRGLDISGYSSSFMLRSVRKRMGRTGTEDLKDYVSLLRSSEEETTSFVGTLSINVTDFFRDKGAFEALSEKVLRPVIQSKRGAGGIVRVWSAGCATGQELYTIAMCLEEEFRRAGSPDNILGTVTGGDLSPKALGFAKKGVYTGEQVKNVPPKMLSEYFVRKGDGFEVGEVLRRRVRFVSENLLEEPRSRMFDVAVCRNVLIYFSRPMHDKVVMNLHMALRQGGYLMLGKTESLVGAPRAYFELVDADSRIFRRLG